VEPPKGSIIGGVKVAGAPGSYSIKGGGSLIGLRITKPIKSATVSKTRRVRTLAQGGVRHAPSDARCSERGAPTREHSAYSCREQDCRSQAGRSGQGAHAAASIQKMQTLYTRTPRVSGLATPQTPPFETLVVGLFTRINSITPGLTSCIETGLRLLGKHGHRSVNLDIVSVVGGGPATPADLIVPNNEPMRRGD